MPVAFIISITVFITTPSKNNRAVLCSVHWRQLHFCWGQRSGFRGLGLVGRHLFGEQEEQRWQWEGNLEFSKSKVTAHLKSTEYSSKRPGGDREGKPNRASFERALLQLIFPVNADFRGLSSRKKSGDGVREGRIAPSVLGDFALVS